MPALLPLPAVLAGCGVAGALPGGTDRDLPGSLCSLVPEPELAGPELAGPELAGLGLTGPGRPVAPPAIGCMWDPVTSGPEVSIGEPGWLPTVPVVLVGGPRRDDYGFMAEAYGGRDRHSPVDVAGRTGVQFDLGGNSCTVAVDLDPGSSP
ncbi:MULTISPECIES: hypothetical protein [Pseudonocardia]|uniref:Uncharacterized protein n=1 Tax=Pseudonocardia autotrophica TaxID=2074 RepID=A0A1Y2MVE9_PSEAH|nr:MULTISPECIES: hypothetical protein [Pseudonocardia]OSY38949.1 hypothetical protein BG845_03821 [Pseudonocardia autotrophica]TDN76205.1 hypothetical protein C8E95_5398 [Pseudonocardia autotrophica]